MSMTTGRRDIFAYYVHVNVCMCIVGKSSPLHACKGFKNTCRPVVAFLYVVSNEYL